MPIRKGVKIHRMWDMVLMVKVGRIRVMAQMVVICVVVNVVSRNIRWMVSMWKFMVVYMNIFRVVTKTTKMVMSSMAGVW